MYNKVIITDVFKRGFIYECNTEQDFKEYIQKNNDACESIGKKGQFIKPIFDIDAYGTDINVDDVKNDINQLYPNKTINYAKREPRNDAKKGMKYSYRFYVDGVKTTSCQIKQLALRNGLDRNKIYDMSIYDDNKVLYLPLTTYKKTMKKECMSCTTVPSLEPVDCDIFKCCASYIQEDFEDWTTRNPDTIQKEKEKEKEKVVVVKEEVVKDNDSDVIDTKYIISKLTSYISKFKNERSDNYDTWTKMVWCIMNICISNGIKERDCAKLVHQFSKISESYNEDDVDTFFDTNYDDLKESSNGWKYMYT